MTIKGKVIGKTILLESEPGIPQGTTVEVTIQQKSQTTVPRKGSPEAVLGLANTLSHEEAVELRKSVTEIRQIDPSLWP